MSSSFKLAEDGEEWQILETVAGTKRKFYYNKITGISTFEKPDELLTAEELARVREENLRNS